jgi:4-amino-4-deoxy-L-arabinose transferase-like glycosyltransferase
LSDVSSLSSGGLAAAAAVPADESKSLSPSTWAWLAALVGWTLVLSFYQLDRGADFEPTDAWVAQTAREMSESTDWKGYVIPHFSGEVRMQKSPGPYWAVLLASRARGTPVDIPATRIPNAIATVMLVLTIFWLTLNIAGQRAALFAGFVAASSVFLLYWSHRGASDLGVTAFMTLSLASLWIGTERAAPGWRQRALWMLGYFAAGMAMLYKMPMPLVCVGLPSLAYVLYFKRWKIFRDWWHLVGLALFFLPWLPWVIALAILQSPPDAAGAAQIDFSTTLNKWRVEFFDRMIGELPNTDGQERDLRMYLLYIGVAFAFAMPFCLSIPQALARPFRAPKGEMRSGMWFLLLWLLTLFLFFTANPGKETRYFLPAMPPLLMLLGIEMASFFDPKREGSALLERLGLLLVPILVALGWAAGGITLYKVSSMYGELGDFQWSAIWPPYVVAALIFCVGATASAWYFSRRKRNESFAALVGTMWLTWLWVWPYLMPVLASERPFIDFAAQMRDRVPKEIIRNNTFQVAQQDSRIIWYGDLRFPRVIDQLELLNMQGGRRSRQREIEIVAGRMIEKLKGADLALFVSDPEAYVMFHSREAADLMRTKGAERPRTYVWLTANVGRPDHRYVLFGNRPPPWPEPTLALPQKVLLRLGDGVDRQATVTQPASAPTSRPSNAPSAPPDRDPRK